MTAEASDATIDARLDALGRLYRLGLSLAEAEGPSLPDRVWLRRCLLVHHKVGVPSSDRIMLRVVAGKVIRVGDELELVMDAAGARVLAETRAILVGASEQGVHADEIRPGRATVAVFQCVNGVPETLLQLPDVGSSVACRLASAADGRRRALRQGGGQ